jgi:hypothetical protein
MVGKTFVTIFGGFGNQLFQVSQALNLANHGVVKLVYPYSWAKGTYKDEYRELFKSMRAPEFCSNIAIRFLSSISTFLSGRHISIGRLVELEMQRDAFLAEKSKYKSPSSRIKILTGYFQNDKQVNDSALAERLAACLRSSVIDREVVTLHVRGGDFIAAKSFYGLLDSGYYKKPLANIKKKLPVFCITNDIPYASDLLGDLDMNLFSGSSVIDDFLCAVGSEFFIGSNSTFSWWIAKTRAHLGRPSNLPEPFFPQASPLRSNSSLWIHGVSRSESEFK